MVLNNNINISACSNDIPRFDVAVIDVSINEINMIYEGSAHLVILDEIDITSNIFHSLFYDLSGQFVLNPLLFIYNFVEPSCDNIGN